MPVNQINRGDIVKEEEFIKVLRNSVGDAIEPYIFTDEQIKLYIKNAVCYYSKSKPTKRIGHIEVVPNIPEYKLPEDYQTWILGLEDYSITDNNVWVGKDKIKYRIDFLYYADKCFSEIPQRDIPLILECCQSEMIEATVMNTIGSENEDKENVASIKLGKGLDITFEDSKQLEKELYAIAQTKKQHFLNEIKNTVSGGWC